MHVMSANPLAFRLSHFACLPLDPEEFMISTAMIAVDPDGWFAHLTMEVRIVLLAVFVILALCSAVSIGLVRLRPNRDYSQGRARVRTWWVIAGLVAGTLLLSPMAAIWFFAFVSFLALKEYLSLIPSRRSDRRVLFWAYAAIPAQFAWVSGQWYGMFIVFIPIYLFMWLPTRMVMIGEMRGYLRAVGTLQWGVMGTVFFLSHAAFLLVMPVGEHPRVVPVWPSTHAAVSAGPGLLLLLLVLTQCNEVAQFFVGRSFGRRQIAPTVSPGITWAGFCGGLLLTVIIAAALGPWMTMLDLPRSLLAGTLVAIAGMLGNLNVAAIERDLGIKETGSMLPGHGGVLDRIDSLIFTAPVFFHFVWYCYG